MIAELGLAALWLAAALAALQMIAGFMAVRELPQAAPQSCIPCHVDSRRARPALHLCEV